MVAFSERTLCYQIGLLLLFVATSVFATGLALPWWAQTRSRTTGLITSHTGLWVGCTSPPANQCSAIDAPGWFKAVQGLQCVSLIGMLVACLYAIFANFCLDHPSFSRTVEMSAVTGGVLGIVSAVLYVAKTSHVLRKNYDVSYSWAFGINVSACVFVTFIAAIIALANGRHGHENTGYVLEECSSETGRRQRTGSQRMKARREMELGNGRLMVSRLARSSKYTAEVIVLQNSCPADPLKIPRPPDTSDCLADCYRRPQWNEAVSIPQGHCHGSGCCQRHIHCCTHHYHTAGIHCWASNHKQHVQHGAAHTSCNAPTIGELPSSATCCQPSCCGSQETLPDSLPPPYVDESCAGPVPSRPDTEGNLTYHPEHCQHGCCKHKCDKSQKADDTGVEDLPRVVATAPPLQAEYGELVADSDDVCVGDEPRREWLNNNVENNRQ